MSPRRQSTEICFRFFGLAVRIRSSVPEFTEKVTQVFFPFRASGSTGRSLASYRVTGKNSTKLSRGGKVVYESERLHYVLEYLESDLLSLLIEHLTGHLLVHAGAVARADNVLLLPGRSGSGKTTLVAGLVRNGFTHVTDEMAVFDAEESRLHPFPKALNMKTGSLELFQPFVNGIRLMDPDGTSEKDRIHHVLIPPEKVQSPAESLRVNRVIFPRFEANGEDCLKPMTRAQAIAEIARASFNHYRLQDGIVECLENLVRPAECYSLVYSRLERALEILEKLCDPVRDRSATGS
ncbi:MAG: hypothetical protein V3T54_00975 [Acidobacteriota bacterium]